MPSMVVMARVLHDFHDSAALEILSNAFQTLKPGGHLIIVEPLGGRVAAFFLPYWRCVELWRKTVVLVYMGASLCSTRNVALSIRAISCKFSFRYTSTWGDWECAR